MGRRVRIRWRGVARAAAIVGVGLIGLRLVPGLLRAPEPPPLGADVGLPKAGPAASTPVRVVRKKPPSVRRRRVPDAAAATATIGTRSRHRPERRRRAHRRARVEPVEPPPPPTPEYVPPPAPEPSPEPLPAPSRVPESTPGDGSEEFAPH